jgi:hypothetical protein
MLMKRLVRDQRSPERYVSYRETGTGFVSITVNGTGTG